MYTVYKINNDLNNNYYIGVHKTNNPNDNYMGSGILIQKQIKEYGLEHFNKEILFIYDTSEDAFNKERELVCENLSNPLCLNIAPGGEGGALFTGKHHSEETKMKNRLAALGRKYIHNEVCSKLVYPEELEKYLKLGWKLGKHKKDCGFGKKAWNKGLQIGSFSEEHKRKISKSVKNNYEYKDETRKKISESMKKYYAEHNIKRSDEFKKKVSDGMKKYHRKRKEIEAHA